MVALSTKHYVAKLRKAPGGTRTIDATVSTSVVDRDGDVLLPGGADLIDFRKNPVMLLGHNAGVLPIGKWLSVSRIDGSLKAIGLFSERPPEHPMMAEWLPDTVHALIQQGVLKGVSVGFIIDDARDAVDKDIRNFGEGVRRVVTKWKLVEISIVPIPANQEALITAVGKGLLSGKSLLPDLWGVAPGEQQHLTLDTHTDSCVQSLELSGFRLPIDKR